MENIYVQFNEEIDQTLKNIGFDSLEQAEEIIGEAIYALDVEYSDGEYGIIYACHDYLENGGRTQLTDADGRLLPELVLDIEYVETNLSKILYRFVTDYHSGQWSRGYRLSCMLQKRLEKMLGHLEYNRIFNGPGFAKNDEELRDTFEYKYLVEKYSEKI